MTKYEEGALFDPETVLGLLDKFYPRMLSQIDRDPSSPTYGSCDRQFWMYRLHDFESGVLQQQGLVLAVLSNLAERSVLVGCRYLRKELAAYWRELAGAIGRRTAAALARRKMLDEYYPGEHSFPATVFASYATLKAAVLLDDREVIESTGLERAARALARRKRSAAANQDMAAAAFLGLYETVCPGRVTDVNRSVDELLGGERSCGLFLEYGGADLGYGTVSLHFLACLLEDGVVDCRDALRQLARLLARFVTPAGRLGGEFASRSTTYALPFGLLEAARLEPSIAGRLSLLDLHGLYEKLDDRYLGHYCLCSLALAARSLLTRGAPVWQAEPVPSVWETYWDSQTGLFAAQCGSSAVFIGPQKGGTLQWEHNGAVGIDCGFRVHVGGLAYATAVAGADPAPEVVETPDHVEIVVRARLLRYGNLIASPFKTIVLRLLTFFGPQLNSFFKAALITKPRPLSGVRIERRIRLEFSTGRLTVEDNASGRTGIHRSPPSSLRLVPSARFHQAGEEEAYLESLRPVTWPVLRTVQLTPAKGPSRLA